MHGYTIKVYPNGLGTKVYRNFEICGDEPIEILLKLIVKDLEVNSKGKSANQQNTVFAQTHISPSFQLLTDGTITADTTLDELSLTKGEKYTLAFDFCENWQFTLRITKMSEVKYGFDFHVLTWAGYMWEYEQKTEKADAGSNGSPKHCHHQAYTLEVRPQGERNIYRGIKISGDATLDDLCMCILKAFKFIHEHLYEFNIGGNFYTVEASEGGYGSEEDDEWGLPLILYEDVRENVQPTTISLDALKLNINKKFTLHYDFGDDWFFKIKVLDIEPTVKSIAPCVIVSKGKLEQYPCADTF